MTTESQQQPATAGKLRDQQVEDSPQERRKGLQGFAEKSRLYERQLLSALAALKSIWDAADNKGNVGLHDAIHATSSKIDLSILHEHDEQIRLECHFSSTDRGEGEKLLAEHDAEIRKPLVDLILECREAVAFLSDKVPYDEMVTPTRHTTSSLCKAIDDALGVKE